MARIAILATGGCANLKAERGIPNSDHSQQMDLELGIVSLLESPSVGSPGHVVRVRPASPPTLIHMPRFLRLAYPSCLIRD